MTNLEKVYNFLNDTKTYFIATVENNKPHVRAFGTILCYENKLYIQTGKKKNVAKQLFTNPNAEICAFNGEKWIRISCKLVEADNRDIRVKMLEKMPELRSMYNEDDGNMVMFLITDAKVTISSFIASPETFEL